MSNRRGNAPLVTLLVFITIALIAGSTYWLINHQRIPRVVTEGNANNTAEIINNTQKEVIKALNENQNYTAGGIYDEGQFYEILGKQYTIDVLPNWEISHEWTNYSDDLYLTSTVTPTYKLHISQSARSAGSCTFDSKEDVGNNPYDYATFIDLTDADNNKYRREDWTKESKDTMWNDKLLCHYITSTGTYSTSTPYGNIWYVFPLEEGYGTALNGFDQSLITEMDRMIKTLKPARR